MSPVVSIIERAHLAASGEDEDKPLPGVGLTYTGFFVEPSGRLILTKLEAGYLWPSPIRQMPRPPSENEKR
ncbi:hypothetical protein JMJ35_000953 [Cladonia borealis]|uniref:Uncharacterized protein n=1 Tax=Cladonia borealis TaxID=184061 RepID=A0AA39R9N0_9LECA|nr:hypothetical protein JMJ35_000953 [Cladonia borealis]